jgi:hypothetical protein
MSAIIHGLSCGLPLCGFSDEVPANWPDNNLWVPSHEEEKITCEQCKEAKAGLRGVAEGLLEKPLSLVVS